MPAQRTWPTDVAPRVGAAGFCAASVTVDRMALQVAATSQGLLPVATPAHRLAIYRATIAKQAALTTLQYGLTRELKFALDAVQPSPALSTVVATGLLGVPCSSLSYNWAIQDAYGFHGALASRKPHETGLTGFARAKVAPGLLWCFLRAGCGTGGALYCGPSVAAALRQHVALPAVASGGGAGRLPERAASLSAGLLTGAAFSLATQCIHNITLVAGRMAALGEAAQAPHYTTVALRQAWREMGGAIFYANFGPRMAINAVTVGVLNLCDIFHAPELSGWPPRDRI